MVDTSVRECQCGVCAIWRGRWRRSLSPVALTRAFKQRWNYTNVARGSYTERMSDESRLGLCASCAHARRVDSARGSQFLLCGLAQTDARFAKYPRLPVIRCAGYEPNTELRGGTDDPQKNTEDTEAN